MRFCVIGFDDTFRFGYLPVLLYPVGALWRVHSTHKVSVSNPVYSVILLTLILLSTSRCNFFHLRLNNVGCAGKSNNGLNVFILFSLFNIPVLVLLRFIRWYLLALSYFGHHHFSSNQIRLSDITCSDLMQVTNRNANYILGSSLSIYVSMHCNSKIPESGCGVPGPGKGERERPSITRGCISIVFSNRGPTNVELPPFD